MTDISNDKAAGLAAFELVQALIQRLILCKSLPADEAQLAAEDAIIHLETLNEGGRFSEAGGVAAALIRARYPREDAPKA